MIYTEKEDIRKALEKFYNEELEKNTVMHGLCLMSEGHIRNMQLKLLQTTQLFVRSFDYDLGEAHSIKRKIINLMKKGIRKMTLFITKPYADQMFQFQQSSCEWMGIVIDVIQKQEEIISKQNKEIRNCSNTIIRLDNHRKQLEEKLKILDKENQKQREEN